MIGMKKEVNVIGKEEIKLSLFIDNMIVSTVNSKGSSKKNYRTSKNLER